MTLAYAQVRAVAHGGAVRALQPQHNAHNAVQLGTSNPQHSTAETGREVKVEVGGMAEESMARAPTTQLKMEATLRVAVQAPTTEAALGVAYQREAYRESVLDERQMEAVPR